MEFTYLDQLQHFGNKGDASTAASGYRGLNLNGKIGFTWILTRDHWRLHRFIGAALKRKECFVGPFVGEFGNMLAHMLPFLGFLHYKGVKVHYCGLTLHKALLIDNKGNSLVETYEEVRDILSEVIARGNDIENLPKDVEEQLKVFVDRARSSGLPFLDLFTDHNVYWYSFRNWQLRGYQHVYNLQEYFVKEKRNKVVIFPRNKTKGFTTNNGAPWDYNKIALLCTDYFQEVAFVGHPSMSAGLEVDHPKISSELSTDNRDILNSCAEAELMITQHSGAMHLAPLVATDVLSIFKGDPPIRSWWDTVRLRKNFPRTRNNLVFDWQGIVDYLNMRKSESNA